MSMADIVGRDILNAANALSNGNVVVEYCRRCDITNVGAPIWRVVCECGACLTDVLEEKLHEMLEKHASDEEIFEKYGMERMPENYVDNYEDEYEGYLAIDCGFGIKAFLYADSIFCHVIRQMDNSLLYFPSLTDKAICYVRTFENDNETIQPYRLTNVVFRSNNPEKYEEDSREFENGAAYPCDIAIEIVTDDDICYCFLDKEV